MPNRTPAGSMALAVLSAALALRPTQAVAEPAARPNILILYVDDVGYGDFGCYGATKVRTPNVDRLAAEGVRFTDAHATAATCTPSRYSILTGRYAFREKRAQVLAADAPLLIEPGSPTLPELLKRIGYNTACIGKWHLGLGNGVVNWNADIVPGPLEVGFERSLIIPATPDRVPCVYVDGHRVVGLDSADPLSISYTQKIGNEPTGADHPELLRYPANLTHSGTIVDHISRIGWMSGGHAAWWTDEMMAMTLTKTAEDFIANSRHQPFFLYFALNDVHVPHAPNGRFIGTSQCGLRGDAIEELDWCVGEIVATLDRLKLRDNTLIILSSDNGPIFLDGYADGSRAEANGHMPAGPFRGGKYQIYEGGTRMPFIVNWPGKAKPGVSNALISQMDLLASLSALVGSPLPPGAGPDSLNLLPVLLGSGGPGRDHLLEEAQTTVAIRRGSWKYIPAGERHLPKVLEDGDTSGGPAVSPDEQLYNLAADPAETRNVIREHPDVAKALAALLSRERAEPQTRPTAPAIP